MLSVALEYLEDFIKDAGDEITITIKPVDAGGNYTVKVLDAKGNVVASGRDGDEAHEVLATAIASTLGFTI